MRAKGAAEAGAPRTSGSARLGPGTRAGTRAGVSVLGNVGREAARSLFCGGVWGSVLGCIASESPPGM